jgi:glycosyltransferase involved in cell wall biosynthesis
MSLYWLLSRMDPTIFENEVVSLTAYGPVGDKMAALGVPVSAVGMRPGMPSAAGMWRLLKLTRSRHPDVIQTWMYHSDLLAGIAGKLTGKAKIVWGIHHGRLEKGKNSSHMLATAKICARLSGRLPDSIVCVSEASRRWHAARGYSDRRMETIPNGFDTDVFHPDAVAYRSVRSELGIPQNVLLVGHVARFDAQKDYASLVRAATQVRQVCPDAQFLLCGNDVTEGNKTLDGWIRRSGCKSSFHLLGVRDDVPRLMAALDVLILCSTSEGFGNCVGEAMACGVPCVVTDVADLKAVVGNTGVVVPPGNVEALTAGLVALLRMHRDERIGCGTAARRRIQENYGLSRTVAAYENVYRRLFLESGKKQTNQEVTR